MFLKVISSCQRNEFEDLVYDFKKEKGQDITNVKYEVTNIQGPYEYGVLYTAFIEYN